MSAKKIVYNMIMNMFAEDTTVKATEIGDKETSLQNIVQTKETASVRERKNIRRKG